MKQNAAIDITLEIIPVRPKRRIRSPTRKPTGTGTTVRPYGSSGLTKPLNRLGLVNLVGGSSGTIDQRFWARWKGIVGA